ncbi:hypothetical protein DRW03_34265 [Corallococcus sp. H22C18031201]|uniref:hypothetical protein n=1 Tax=Citreicoccus inhibens TaxID=2849499 RepID=UPI000E74AFFB|nr:hypothetical protein [Citreicoccus inhibens]MBU8896679.1 hypothetical protein [Citreicoccus inhibens]RJS14727.1 hypothetical protein DRW03_34265 [Corallococcus sp. H22C18031201]
MSRIAVAALILAATGCATTGSVGGPGGTSTVSGVVSLPKGGLQGNPCDSVRVVVSSDAAPGAALGNGMIKLTQRGDRCQYTVSGLPHETDLKIDLVVGADVKCTNGTAPTATPGEAPLKMQKYQTALRDFQLTCAS